MVVEFPSDQEIRQASLEGGYFKKENWHYRKGGLVIGVPIKILESVLTSYLE